MEKEVIVEKLTPIFRNALKRDDLTLVMDLKPEDVDSWDSLANMTIVSDVQEVFNVKFTLKEMMKFTSVGGLVTILESKI